jgi:hypothetical protein
VKCPQGCGTRVYTPDPCGTCTAVPARRHLAKLRETGWTWQQIAGTAGIGAAAVRRVSSGRGRVQRGTALLILAIPPGPPPGPSRVGVDQMGTRRRVEALAWLGWPRAEIARRAGIREATLQTVLVNGRRPSSTLARRVADVYEQLAMTPGPSTAVAAHARRAGYLPPLAWDEDTIDDPVPIVSERARIARGLANRGAGVLAIARAIRSDRLTVHKLLEAS